MTSGDAERYHQLLIRVVDRASLGLGSIAFNKEEAQHLALACLYATLVQSTRECLLLISEPTVTLPAVLRSILEAFADLRALIKDPAHGERMVATFEHEKKRLLKNMLMSSSNPYHEGLLQKIDASAELQKVEAEITRLRLLGYKQMSNRERFEWADLEHEFESIYWLLCLDSHNSLSAIERRHLIWEGEDYELIAAKENHVEQICKWCDVLARILVDATIRLYGLLGISRVGGFEEDLSDLARIRAELFGQ
jgi:hypothetical protein